MALEQLWAGWRGEYIESATSGREEPGCVMCRLVSSADDREALVVARTPHATVALNLYPYTSGHVMVMPNRHVADPGDLDAEEGPDLWSALTSAVAAVRRAYRPDGVNLGANLGHAAGAGVPDHMHLHVLPRWTGDTNFTTAVAGLRVLPEALPLSWEKLRQAFG